MVSEKDKKLLFKSVVFLDILRWFYPTMSQFIYTWIEDQKGFLQFFFSWVSYTFSHVCKIKNVIKKINGLILYIDHGLHTGYNL